MSRSDAARYVSQRAASSSVAMSASLNWIAWNFEIGWPNCTRCARVLGRQVEHGLRQAERQRGDRDAPDLERAQELAEPHRRIADEVIVGDPHVVEVQLARVEAAPADAAHLRAHREAGGVLLHDEARERRRARLRPTRCAASSVTPNDMSVPALEMNVLRPLISQPPSRRTARVRMPRASEPASGSVKPNAPSARPSASGRSQRSRCASLPKRYSGNEPIVTCACHAAATDWSARPICSIAATKPTVDMPMPPHCSGISMPSRPNAPISRSRSVGQRASSHASGARTRDLLLRELAAEADQIAFRLGEREVHGRILLDRPVQRLLLLVP